MKLIRIKLISKFLSLIISAIFLLLTDSTVCHSDDISSQIREEKTKKNLTYWYLENCDSPTVSLAFTFKNLGSAFDPPTKQGLSKLSINSLFQSCKSSLGYDLDQLRDKFSISFNETINNTSFIVKINTLTENLEYSLDFLSNCLISSKLDKPVFDRMASKAIIQANIFQQYPIALASNTLTNLIFGKHPYSNSTIGNNITLSNLKFEDAATNLENKFNKNDLSIAVVGDVKSLNMSNLLDKYLSDLTIATKKTSNFSKLNWPYYEATSYVKLDSQQTIIAFAIPYNKSLSLYDIKYLQFKILNSALNNLLFKKIREDLGATYSPYSSINLYKDPLSDNYFMDIWGFITTNNDSATKVINSIRNLFQQIRTHGINEDEINTAKSKISFQNTYHMSSNLGAASILSSLQSYGLNLDYTDVAVTNMKNINFQDMNLFTKEFFANKNYILVEVGKEDHIT